MRSQVALLSLLLAACAGSSTSPVPPPVRVEPEPRPVVSPPSPVIAQPQGHWTDWPISPGNWVYRADERGSISYFGNTGQDALVTLRCDKARARVYLSRAGAGSSRDIAIRTSSISKTLQAAPNGDAPPYIASELSPMDPILDAMAYSKGRFAIESNGLPSLAIPAWAEISRVIEDCRA